MIKWLRPAKKNAGPYYLLVGSSLQEDPEMWPEVSVRCKAYGNLGSIGSLARDTAPRRVLKSVKRERSVLSGTKPFTKEKQKT